MIPQEADQTHIEYEFPVPRLLTAIISLFSSQNAFGSDSKLFQYLFNSSVVSIISKQSLLTNKFWLIQQPSESEHEVQDNACRQYWSMKYRKVFLLRNITPQVTSLNSIKTDVTVGYANNRNKECKYPRLSRHSSSSSDVQNSLDMDNTGLESP